MRKQSCIAALVATLLAGCASEPIVADIGQDKVQFQSTGSTAEQIHRLDA